MTDHKTTMKHSIFFLFIFAVGQNVHAQKILKSENEVEIKVNPNLETFAIVERLCLKHNRFLKYRDSLLTTEPSMRPMVTMAYQEFSKHENGKCANRLAAILDTLFATKSGGQDLFFSALLSHKPFPAKGYNSPFHFQSTNLTSEQNKFFDYQISLVIEEMRQFYIANKVANFIKTHQSFYEGSMSEIRKNIPKNIIETMDGYYRNSIKNKYVVIPMPSRPWANREWSANGPSLPLTDGSKQIYQILSTHEPIPIDKENKYTKFGFDNSAWLEELTVHEFGHSYVHIDLDQFDALIDKTSFLFGDDFEKDMKKVSTWSWRVCVEEHIVRTVEIRIAEKQGNRERAEKLRTDYIKNDKYIFIPILETKYKEYETNPTKYPTFKNFIPELLTTFNTITTEQRDKLLKDSDQK